MMMPDDYDYLPDISNVSSSMECTGLMPTPPLSEDEYESYHELYSMEASEKEDNIPDNE